MRDVVSKKGACLGLHTPFTFS